MMQNHFSTKVQEYLSKEWEFVKLSASFLSIVVTAVMLPFITILFAGKINQAHLDGVGLANTIYNVVVMSASFGYSSVFDTYGPQVYASDDSSELGTVLVKCLLQGGLVNLIFLGPYLNVVYVIDILPNEGLYPTFGKGGVTGVDDFRDIAVQYLRLTVLLEYLDYSVMMILKYFAIQGHTKLVYIVSVVMAVTHLLANYLLVSVLGLGVGGLGLAAITGRLTALAVSVGICVVKVKRGVFAWNGFNIKVFLGWKPMIKMGFSGALLCFAEVGMYEMSTFTSQFIGTATLSVVIILFQIMAVWWSITFSISRAAATLIGKALAEGSALDVKMYLKLSLINTLLEAVPLALVSYLLRGYLVRIFQDDPEVVYIFTTTFWLACLGLTVNHFQTCMNQGVLIAFGEQSFIAWSMSIACYGVGVPFILMTIFLTDLGVTGLFLGFIISDTIILIAALVKFLRSDIGEEIKKSRQRVSNTTHDSSENVASRGGFDNPVYKAEGEEVGVGTISPRSSTENGLNNVQDVLDDKCSLKEMPGDARSADKGEASREVKGVLIVFFVAAVICVTLAGASLLRGKI